MYLHIPGGIHHTLVREIVHKGEDHTVSGGNSQLGSTGRDGQKHSRGKGNKKKRDEDAHVQIHFYIKCLEFY